MSNNLISEPIPSMQMAQLVDSSGRQMDILSTDPMSRHQGTSNVNNVGLSTRAMPVESTSHGLPLSNMGSGQVEAREGNILGMHRTMQMGTMESNLESQQLSATPKRKALMLELPPGSSMTSNKRVAQMGHRPWLQQASNTSNKGSPHAPPPSSASRMQHQAASNKRKTQMDSSSSKSGTPRSSNSKSQSAQMKESSKVQSESSESIRSKMRESLAAALALVSQQDKPLVSNNNKPDAAANAQGKLENSYQSTDTVPEQRQEISQSGNSSFAATDSVDHVMGEHGKHTTSSEDFSEKCKDYEAGSTNVSNNENILSSDMQDFQSSYTLTTDDVPFSDGFFMKDELLQGNGLSWVLSDVVDVEIQSESQTNIEKISESKETDGVCQEAAPLPELLASRIEAELFKLFGGVNKKYKEKGRSLLFNLKDRNNPELRERVMFGKIPPEQLCSMTAEELASKELSEWRIAKAEEFAQMVVLPDSDGDIRRLVKKTHKGEFQVEVDHEDNVLVEEVSGGTTSVAHSEKNEDDTSSKPDVIKSDVKTDGEKSDLQKDNQFSISISSNDGIDPMQGLMTDDALKDPDFLPTIVSLDEFMESLHSEPPFENLPVESGKVSITDKVDSGVGSKSKFSDLTPSEQDGVGADKSGKFQSTVVSSGAEEEKRVNATSGSIMADTRYGMKPMHGHTMERSTDGTKSTSNEAELRVSQFHTEERYGNDKAHSKTAVPIKGECLWEGMLQPNISTTQSVISIFKSGEKTSAKDWPGFLEIKGRVRLDAFQKFLLELPQSRTRAIMVLHFVSKGSDPDEQSTLREVADSYIVDERVGFAEPMHGVELYFCPPHKNTVEMLSKILPKEQIEAVNSIENGLIGFVVWRKTNITSSISPTTQAHNKHSSKRQFSRRPQDTNVNVTSTHKAVPSTSIKTVYNGPSGSYGDDDDVPPGFGPPVARIEDDLPEFKFSGGSTPSHLVQKPMGPGMVPFPSVGQTQARPAEQMRELVHKYGQNKAVSSVNLQDRFGVTIQPWNDDDDDMPEWQPHNSQNQFQTQQTMHNFHLRPHIVNQTFAGLPQQSNMTTQYMQGPMNVSHVPQNFVPHWVPPTHGNNIQPSAGTPAQGAVWPQQHISRSRGL